MRAYTSFLLRSYSDPKDEKEKPHERPIEVKA